MLEKLGVCWGLLLALRYLCSWLPTYGQGGGHWQKCKKPRVSKCRVGFI